MQKRLRIINSKTLTPSDENFVIVAGINTMNMFGVHSNEKYIEYCHKLKRGTLVYNR